MVGLPDAEKNFKDMYNRLDSIPACDRQTDKRTSCHGIVRAMHTRGAVKTLIVKSQTVIDCIIGHRDTR